VQRQAGCIVPLVGMLAVVGLGLAALSLVPPALLPWTPLSLADPPNPTTASKLAALTGRPDVCRALLDQAGVEFEEAADRREKDYCVVEDAIIVRGGSLPLSPKGAMMRCPVAVGLVLWQRHGLEPLAGTIVGSELARISHIGTYNCRRQRGNNSGLPSEHARANAIDITGFEFANGTTIRLPGGWDGQADADEQSIAFLQAAQDEACEIFEVVLGPRANAAHADHFHLDLGPFSSCR
jgi:hypothetical protein